MPEIKLDGTLQFLFTEFLDSFNGGFSRYGGTGSSFVVSSGFPFGSTLHGTGIFTESSGPNFMRGTVTGFELTEISLSPTTVTSRLEITGVSALGSSLIDLVSRDATTIRGEFNENVLQSLLRKKDWNITGDSGVDVVSSSASFELSGDDDIRTFGGSDRIEAGDGADRVLGGAGQDFIFGGAGRDLLVGAGGNDIMSGDGQADRLLGGAGNDTMGGGFGNDKLVGGKGRDTLTGEAGKDVLNGGLGNDLLNGGTGRDQFIFDGGTDEGRDRIADFDISQDQIRISDANVSDVTIGKAGLGTRIELSSGTEIILIGVDASTITVDDLIFV